VTTGSSPARALAEIVPMPPAAAAQLEVRGVSKTWQRTRRVLDNVDLDLAPGRFVALVGANGAGKTTFLRILAGLIMADEGSVRLDGLDPFRNRREYQRRLGFLSAGQGGLYARLSPRRHLDYWASIAFIPRGERRQLTERAVEQLELEEFAGRRVDRLSMGQRQRVRLAMAFMHEPLLVLLDEPSNSLDADGIAVLQRAIDNLTARGGTAVWCAPSTDSFTKQPDEVLSLTDGRLERE
jgi:ABC-type multidrug transport system ATPase subunit